MTRRQLVSVLVAVGIVVGCIVAEQALEALTGWDLTWEGGYVAGVLVCTWLNRGSIPWRQSQQINRSLQEMQRILSKYDNNEKNEAER